MEPFAKAKVNQRREHRHVGDRYGIKGLFRHSNFAGSKVSGHAIGGHHQAEDDHQTCRNEPEQAQAAMQIHAAGGDQRGLRDQQNDPG